MKSILWLPAVFLTGALFYAKADVIPPGAQITVQPERTISVSRFDSGRIYRGRVANDVIARDGDVAIPAGSPVELIIRQVSPDRMSIDLESITANGRRYVVDNTGPEFQTRAYEDGDGLVGGIVGAITGIEPEGDRVYIPAGSTLTFQLQEPLRVVGWADPGYDRGGEHYHHEHDWYR